MIKRIMTICAALAAGAAGTSLGVSLALAQGYSQPPGSLYSASPAPYPPGGYIVDERRRPGAPDFDALDDDDDAPNAQSSTALPPPGPVLSPSDPRYGRPDSRPVYSDRSPGPILSPSDPRYGRPDGPPPVIYSDRPAGPPQQTYSDRGSDDSRDASARSDRRRRYPGVTGSVQPQGARRG